MVHIQFSGPLHSRSLQPTTKIAGKVLLGCALVMLAVMLFSAPAQASLPLGFVQDPVPLSSCPGSGWFSYTDTGGTHMMNRFAAGLAGCSNAQNLGFTYGYLSPSGIILGPVKGVIVFFSGRDGTTPAGDATGTPAGEFDFANYYFTHSYEIVQVAWNSAWQATQNPFPQGTYGNIQYGACRPATFLHFVYNNIFQPLFQSNPNAGMCAQGSSAGSAALGYSLAYYGAGSYLDNVELMSGPVLSDIEQGCEMPNTIQTTICGVGQWGCQLGPNGSSWTLSPKYLAGANSGVGSWTNDNTCTSPSGTTQASDLRWLQQSIVDDGTNSPTFNYPGTAMGAWLCRSVKNPNHIDCSNPDTFNPNYCPNNSSPQGEIFYANITSSNSPPVYNVWAVDQCGGPEGVGTGNVGSSTGIAGTTAIEQDMAGTLTPPTAGQCVHRAH